MQRLLPQNEELENYFNNKKDSDITLVVADRYGGRVAIPAHKVILTSNMEMFKHGIDENPNFREFEIDLSFATVQEFVDILKAIYSPGNGLCLKGNSGKFKLNDFQNYSKYNIDLVKYLGAWNLYRFLLENPFDELLGGRKFKINKDSTKDLATELFNLNLYELGLNSTICIHIFDVNTIALDALIADKYLIFGVAASYFQGNTQNPYFVPGTLGDVQISRPIIVNLDVVKLLKLLLDLDHIDKTDPEYNNIVQFSKTGQLLHPVVHKKYPGEIEGEEMEARRFGSGASAAYPSLMQQPSLLPMGTGYSAASLLLPTRPGLLPMGTGYSGSMAASLLPPPSTASASRLLPPPSSSMTFVPPRSVSPSRLPPPSVSAASMTLLPPPSTPSMSLLPPSSMASISLLPSRSSSSSLMGSRFL